MTSLFTRGTPEPERRSAAATTQTTTELDTALETSGSSKIYNQWVIENPRAAIKELFTGPQQDAAVALAPATGRDWTEDFLGRDYQSTAITLDDDDEGSVEAIVVRYRPIGYQLTARAILYIHGWCDYFHQRETAEFWDSQGSSFYALDLRKYGRSLRAHQTAGYTASLSDYAQEISQAIAIIKEELGPNVSIMLHGHSTGGLVCALWAQHNPGVISGIVLNSPWLELQGSSIVRMLATPGLSQLARIQPKAPLPNIDPGFYSRTVNKHEDGEWELNPHWRTYPVFAVRPGWLNAITTGHAEVARGLDIDVPVLVLISAKTSILMRWSEEIRTSDSVLDVEVIAKRAIQLGSLVTIQRIKDGLHDLSLSPKPVREKYYDAILKWSLAYGWSN